MVVKSAARILGLVPACFSCRVNFGSVRNACMSLCRNVVTSAASARHRWKEGHHSEPNRSTAVSGLDPRKCCRGIFVIQEV